MKIFVILVFIAVGILTYLSRTKSSTKKNTSGGSHETPKDRTKPEDKEKPENS